ncbi:biotin transporter BioY [Rhizobium sp. KVB221]|uniref:Biotin transporter n=1 Tax=Rhizobium setariae TaxID=2801340 RepID=A0A936YMD9_9HYPH|nr:biotin transporter BioY [Rhizobium setariae]MBL0370804.1 biotin transporter BioY [Rhizobium setariae]
MIDITIKSGAQTLESMLGGSLARKATITVLGSLFLAALSQIEVPFFPVPMTLQTLGVMLIGLTFGFRLATATVALYLVEGFIGLPVFAGFAFGPAVFVGGTAGYLFGFLGAAALMGFAADRGMTKSWLGAALTLLAGEVVIFGLGIAYLAYLYGFENALAYGLYPFVLADLVKMALAVLIGKGVIKGASRFAKL